MLATLASSNRKETLIISKHHSGITDLHINMSLLTRLHTILSQFTRSWVKMMCCLIDEKVTSNFDNQVKVLTFSTPS